MENYEFPCVGAWDGFHVNVCSRLKNYYSFKTRYTVTNMGLIGYNKRFLALTTGAPGSTHDARLLRYSNVYRDILNGDSIPDKAIDLGDEAGETLWLPWEIAHSLDTRGCSRCLMKIPKI